MTAPDPLDKFVDTTYRDNATPPPLKITVAPTVSDAEIALMSPVVTAAYRAGWTAGRKAGIRIGTMSTFQTAMDAADRYVQIERAKTPGGIALAAIAEAFDTEDAPKGKRTTRKIIHEGGQIVAIEDDEVSV